MPSTAIVVPYILNILKGYKLKPSDFDTQGSNINQTILTYHRIIEAFKHAFGFRSHLGDPGFGNIDEQVDNALLYICYRLYIIFFQIHKKLLSAEFGDLIRSQINDDETFDDFKIYNGEHLVPNNQGTSHISIISQKGDAVSLTSSINY